MAWEANLDGNQRPVGLRGMDGRVDAGKAPRPFCLGPIICLLRIAAGHSPPNCWERG